MAAISVAFAVGSVCTLIALISVLVFLWKVYDRGGGTDLAAAARAVRDARERPWIALTRHRVNAREDDDTKHKRRTDQVPSASYLPDPVEDPALHRRA